MGMLFALCSRTRQVADSADRTSMSAAIALPQRISARPIRGAIIAKYGEHPSPIVGRAAMT